MEQPPATTVGTMTGAANEVEEHLAKLRLPPRVTSFTNWMKRHTFGNAGFHAQSRRDASWCYFYREDVMQYTELSKFEVLHARKWLEDAHIIFYDTHIPRSADPRAKNPDGRVTWNLDYSQWNAPMPKARGGARPGAGNPNWKKQQPTIAQIDRTQAGIAQIESKTAAEPFQKMQSQLDNALSKNTMAASFERTAGVSAPKPVIKVTEEVITEEGDAYASPAQSQMFPIVTQQRDKPKAGGGSKKKGYTFDALYYKLVELFGKPLGGAKHYWHQTVLPQLREDEITPEQLGQAAQAYKERYASKGLAFTVKAVFNNLSDLLTPAEDVVPPAPGPAANYRYYEGPSWLRQPTQEGGR